MQLQWKNRILAAIFAGVCFTQAADVIPPDVRRVGAKLACLCKTCRNTVGDCTMLECHYSKPARTKIQTMAAAGTSDDQIVSSFVQERGLQALSVPPSEGFNAWLGWMPWLAGGIGLAGIALFIKRNNRRKPEERPPAAISPAAMDKYRASIEKDLADLD